MNSTKAVNSLKNLFASYHQPLPLSAQQSQKLLDGLKVSFRKQLDREYGPASDSPAAPAKAATHDNTHVQKSPANRHLNDILSNPLFTYKKDITSTLATASLPRSRDPMVVFDQAVARGLMSLKAAIGCMITKGKQLQTRESGDRLASSETASRVIQWLRSSGAEKDLQFLDNKIFVRTLAPFLVAEGLEPVAWDWLSRTVNDTSGELDDDKRLSRASHLLAELVRTKCSPQSGDLDAAISTMLQAQHLYQTSPMLSELLVLSWRSVSWFSTVEAYSQTAPSEKLFDAHIATANSLPAPFLMERAHLHLHHPTHPDHVPALEFFEDKERLRRLVHSKKSQNDKLSVLPWLASLGQDTVTHLSQTGRAKEARGVTELLQVDLAQLFHGRLEPA
ncbi:hypothetical protein G7046_g1932 [Stylonectria norvegica]|nr:hypothetical protein G7046_g1932 [Stylonectria norvegica]